MPESNSRVSLLSEAIKTEATLSTAFVRNTDETHWCTETYFESSRQTVVGMQNDAHWTLPISTELFKVVLSTATSRKIFWGLFYSINNFFSK